MGGINKTSMLKPRLLTRSRESTTGPRTPDMREMGQTKTAPSPKPQASLAISAPGEGIVASAFAIPLFVVRRGAYYAKRWIAKRWIAECSKAFPFF